MVTLKEEEAFAFALQTDVLDIACSFCFAYKARVFKCEECKIVSYCSKKCQEMDCADHVHECLLLREWKKSYSYLPGTFRRLTSRILLKSKEDLARKAFNGRSWDSLTANVGERLCRDERYENNYKCLVDSLKNFISPLKKLSPEDVEITLRTVLTYGFNTYDRNSSLHQIGLCIYPGLSVHQHSCLPDCILSSTGTRMVIRILNENTVYSSKLTICYLSRIPFTMFHSDCQELIKNFSSNCFCDFCKDKNHIMKRMGNSCYVSCCKDGAGVLDENSKGPYRCNKCGKASRITQEQVEAAQINLDVAIKTNNQFLESTGIRNVRDSLKMFKKQKKVLSMFNYYMIDLCIQIAYWSRSKKKSLAIELGEAVKPAIEYYLPEGHPERTRYIMTLASLKFLPGNEKKNLKLMEQAYQEALLTYGEDHEVVKMFRRFTYDMSHAYSTTCSLL